jgi:hypothetical protein
MESNGAPTTHGISDRLAASASIPSNVDEVNGGPKFYGDTRKIENSQNLPSEAGNEDKKIGLASRAYGYTVCAIGGIAVALEQLPVNENWRVKEAVNTLIATGSAWAVTHRVFDITNRIEVAASLAVALAVFSKNKVVQAPKEALYRWSEQGEKREEYRAEVKEEEKDFRRNVENNWRVAQAKKPKGMSKAEKLEYKYGRKIEKAQSELEEIQKFRHFPANDVIRANEKLGKLEVKLEAKKEKIRLKEEKGKRTDNLGAKVVKVVSKEMEDFGIALGLGAAIVVFNNGVRNREYNYKNFIADTVKSSLAIATVSAFIAWTVATGTQKAKLGIPLTDYTLHYEDQAKFIVDYGLNTKAIIGALLAAQSPSLAKKLWHRMPKREAKFQQWLAEGQNTKEQHVGKVALATS